MGGWICRCAVEVISRIDGDMDGRIDDGLRYLRIVEIGKTDERVLMSHFCLSGQFTSSSISRIDRVVCLSCCLR